MSLQIDIIDFTKENAKNKFVKSLKNTGFAVLNNHQIDINLINTVYNEWANFFNSKDKYDYMFDLEKQDGYFPMKSENAKGYSVKDIKEFYHIYLPWGRIPEQLLKNTLLIRSKLKSIGIELLSWIDDLAPIDIKNNFSMPLQDMVEGCENNLLRIIHYPPLRENDDKNAIRAAAHEDVNLITVLISGSEPGLQVLDKNNNWVDVKSDPGWLIINIGDMLQECSNAYFPSTTHRVINPILNNNSRFSIPFFLHPRGEVILSKKHTAKTYLDERLKELGLRK
jgi:isopenicillin N synthase-like dioxygenase